MSKREEEPYRPEVAALRDTIAALRTDPPKRVKYLGKRLKEILGLMPLFPDQFIYVYNYSEGRMLYARGFPEVLGYKNEEVDIELLYRIFHPDDAPIVARINTAVIEAMTRIRRPLDPFELCLTVDYRVRKANGQYIKVLRQTAVFDSDPETGEVISTFSLCKDISTIKSSNSIGWQVKGRGADLLDLNALEDLMPKLQYRPTMREMEVIRKLAEGKSSKRIAHELHLSEHTVAAHRRNLLKRTGLKNTAELVGHVKEAGWL
ncbi:MAG: hypothetical protein KA791_02585 [Flavobacteriales bacterium]|nr:hypothetical protein [Flavobacteriales bacterium]